MCVRRCKIKFKKFMKLNVSVFLFQGKEKIYCIKKNSSTVLLIYSLLYFDTIPIN